MADVSISKYAALATAGAMLFLEVVPIGFGHGGLPIGLLHALGMFARTAPCDSPVVLAMPIAIGLCAAEAKLRATFFRGVRIACYAFCFLTGYVYTWIGVTGQDSPRRALEMGGGVLQFTWIASAAVAGWFLIECVWRLRPRDGQAADVRRIRVISGSAAVVMLALFVANLAAGEMSSGRGALQGIPLVCWSRPGWQHRGELIVPALLLDVAVIAFVATLMGFAARFAGQRSRRDARESTTI